MEVIRIRCLPIAAVMYFVAFVNSGDPLLLAQDGSAASHQSILGTVTSVAPERLYVNGPYGSSVVVLLEKGAQVMKKGSRHDFSDVHVGDRVLMRGQRNVSGDFVASEVWVNFTSFYGRILSVNADGYEVRLVTEAGEVTDETRKVAIDSDTLGEGKQPLQRSELAPGRDVQIFGIKGPDGAVLATRVLILRTSVPVGATIITPNGTKVIKKQNFRPSGHLTSRSLPSPTDPHGRPGDPVNYSGPRPGLRTAAILPEKSGYKDQE